MTKSSHVHTVTLKFDRKSATNLYTYLTETIKQYPQSNIDGYVTDARRLIVSLEKIIEEYNME